MTQPPTPYNKSCTLKRENGGNFCQGQDLHGPHGWCIVEMFQGEEDVAKEDRWGFCSRSCEEKEASPSTYHMEAQVDILHNDRCEL